MQTYLILLKIGRWLLVRAQLSWLVLCELVKGECQRSPCNQGPKLGSE